MNWLKKGMKIVCNENNLSGDIGKEYEVYMISNESQSLNKRVIKVIGRGSFKVDEIDWEKTAELNGIDLDKQKYIDTCVENGMSIEKAIKECEIVSKPFNPKHDENKLDWSLLPFVEIEKIVEVLDYGVKKYGKKDLWKNVENAKQRYNSALLRHVAEYQKGNVHDKESNLHHLSHAICNALFILWFESEEK